jgi:hypothetical protein
MDRATDLCFIMNYFGSDKGDPIESGNHNYTQTYDQLFKDIRKDKLRIFELGLGTNNPNFPSNMGVNGKPGASLRGWKQYFKNSEIFGADIDKGILFEEDRIKTFYCDQNNGDAIHEMWAKPELESGFDIIIEDGLHI